MVNKSERLEIHIPGFTLTKNGRTFTVFAGKAGTVGTLEFDAETLRFSPADSNKSSASALYQALWESGVQTLFFGAKNDKIEA